MPEQVDRLEAGAAVIALASAAAIVAGLLEPVPWAGLPVLVAGLAGWRRLRERILPGLRLPWLVVVLAASFGAADLVGVGLPILGASLVVGLLLALAQAAQRRLPGP